MGVGVRVRVRLGLRVREAQPVRVLPVRWGLLLLGLGRGLRVHRCGRGL